MADELLDVVDEQDNVVGTEWRTSVYERRGNNFRAANAFVMNSRGELWIPRRVATKKIFPLCLDFSVAGHVASGETYDETFARETREEINVDIRSVPHRLLGHTSPHMDGMSCFAQTYLIELSETPDYNTDDFFEYYWLTPEALLERLAAGDKSKDDLPKLVRKFFMP